MEKWWYNFKLCYEQYLKIDECNAIKHDFNKTPTIYLNLNAIPSKEQQLRLNRIKEIKDCFLDETREKELISKNFSKYIASLDYFDKSLNVSSILSRSISVASFATDIGALAGIIGASCGFTFSVTSGFVKKFLKTIRNKKNTIKLLC